MTTESDVDSAPTGAVEQKQEQNPLPTPLPQGEGAGAATPATAAPMFSAEQQAHIDKIVAERLRRDRAKWQADAEAKAKAEADEAEAKRQAEQGEWETLARKHETAAAEAKGQVKELSAQLERANEALGKLVESRKAGLPEALLATLEGRDLFDQLALVDAFQASLPAAGSNGAGPRQATPPTPQPQGQRELTAEERRQRAARIW